MMPEIKAETVTRRSRPLSYRRTGRDLNPRHPIRSGSNRYLRTGHQSEVVAPEIQSLCGVFSLH